MQKRTVSHQGAQNIVKALEDLLQIKMGETTEDKRFTLEYCPCLGKNIMGTDFDFDIKLRSGAGAYVCGEETALFESIEGKRSEPRFRPPFPGIKGLFGKPTVLNNVETLANVAVIFQNGASWYRQIGTENSPGTKLFTVCGNAPKTMQKVRERQRAIYEEDKKLPLRKSISRFSRRSLENLKVPPANRLEALHGDREGQYSIRINDQYRICFSVEGRNEFYHVEIVDYH